MSVGQDLSGLNNPRGYSGLYGFHKYWGKKPIEPLKYLINIFTKPGETVVDPFLGSGNIAREALLLGRRFFGSDLNPFATKLANFVCKPCDATLYDKEFKKIENSVRHVIDHSYGSNSQATVSHILWSKENILQVWERFHGKRKRIERMPSDNDLENFVRYSEYTDIGTRPLLFFDNSRINSKEIYTWQDIFTGRALHNIKLLKTAIESVHPKAREAMELTLTASIGQMSKMVFAISSRGKNTGTISTKIEVGSWVIGYWCPETHFEINVWNCFETKAKRLLQSLSDISPIMTPECHIEQADAHTMISSLPNNSINLLITDPPHGDRIPYLELSELWNATLNLYPDFENEVVVSNARKRRKNRNEYIAKMSAIISAAIPKLSNNGTIALLFNSRNNNEWSFIKEISETSGLRFIGTFPISYSAHSVVQSNRKDGMKTDQLLLFAKSEVQPDIIQQLRLINNWRDAIL